MKTQNELIRCGVWATMGLALVVGMQALGAPPVMRDAATHQQLLDQQRREAAQDPMAGMTPCHDPDPALANAPKDLLGQSDILCFGGMATLVPKRALLGVPGKFKSRTKIEEGARILTWVEFLAKNSAWITTVEVTPDEAAGRELLSQKTLQQVAECGTVVVATFLGGPVSVLEYKPGPGASPARK